jgi:hypothetical protein
MCQEPRSVDWVDFGSPVRRIAPFQHHDLKSLGAAVGQHIEAEVDRAVGGHNSVLDAVESATVGVVDMDMARRTASTLDERNENAWRCGRLSSPVLRLFAA